MDIGNTKELKSRAAEQLERAGEEKRILLIYTALVLGLSAGVTLVNYLLGLQISQTGGLGSIGFRSVLSTVQTVLPIAQSVVMLCLDLGFLAAMQRIARGQYVSAQTLRLGFDRFWPLLRLTLLKGLMFAGVGFLCIYLATMIFLLTPLSKPAMEILLPLMNQVSTLNPQVVLDDTVYLQLTSAMMPVMLIFAVIYCAAAAPLAYALRMSEYVLIDKPGTGALAAIRESRKMTRRKRLKLLRLDLGLWWYYAALLGAMAVCYGDQILAALGVKLPWSEDVSFFLFYGLYLAAQFAVYYFLRGRVEVTYALAYDALRPRERQENGVVLGNIFQM